MTDNNHNDDLNQEQEEQHKEDNLDDIARKAKERQKLGKDIEEFERLSRDIDNGKGKVKGEKKAKTESKESEFENKKKKHHILKHSEKGLIAETVAINGKSYYVISRLNGDNEIRITLEDSIEDQNDIFIPLPNPMSRIYNFKSSEEFDEFIEKAKNENLDSLYNKVKAIWKKYIDADDFHISLCAADTIFSYFQDKIGLTHYLFFVGSGDTGKTNNLTIFEYVGYRGFNSIGMTPANIYTTLGNGEEGQGTIYEDEADNIDFDHDKMKYYKSGYQSGKKVVRTDLPQGIRIQNKWNTFCFKAFAAERLPDIVKAKGFHQRIIVLKCNDGFPKYDLAEVIGEDRDSKDTDRDQEFKTLFNELEDTHNLLLAYKLLHYHKAIPNIKLNIRNREKQLFKPILRIFQNTNTLNELLPVVSNYINQRREKNYDSLEGYVFRIVDDLIKARNSNTLESSIIWTNIKESLSGQEITNRPMSYDTAQFGIISQKKITAILEDQFDAKKSTHKGSSNKLVFNPNRLKGLKRKYNLVKVKVVANEYEIGEDEEDGEDHRGIGMDSYTDQDSQTSKTFKENTNNSINDSRINQDLTENNDNKGLTHPYNPPKRPNIPTKKQIAITMTTMKV